MKNYLIYFTLLTIFVYPSYGQDDSIFPKGNKAKNVHHYGEVWLKELLHADSNFNFNISMATSSPGARLNWHSHPGGQILLVLDGEGYYQEKGREKQIIKKGDVIKCSPEVEHWHAATPESPVTYLSISPAGKGGTTWLHKLEDKEYFGEDVLEISKLKWKWMADRTIDSLAHLFDDNAMFVHMGGNMTKEQEINVIKTGGIQYKYADIQETSVQYVGTTAIVLSKIRLTAVVGGNEVVNPFTVTEVYVLQGERWKLASLSFTKLLGG
jgi:4-carboxymuconolactone decarboxylase